MRKEAEERVKAERQRLHDLFMQAPAIIVVLRGPGHIIELANPLALQFLGTHRPLIGKPVREAVPELDEQGFFELLDMVYQTGKPFVGNEAPVHLDRKGGGRLEELYFNFVYQPTSDASGNSDGVIAYGVDVTEQVKARRHSEELMQQKDDFLAVASHELKTPVTSIKGFTNVLQRRLAKQGDEQGLHYLSRMEAQIDKLTALISELLDISRMQSGKLTLRAESFDLDALIDETVETVQVATSTHQLLVEGRTGAQVFGDQERLGQVFVNLFTNAIKYSPRADRVLVHLFRDDDGGPVIVSVQDFGIGIDKTHHEKIFERFYQVTDPEERTYPGLGIGLYISSEMVARHHGRMWVESSKGKGATFCVALPLLSQRAQAGLE